MTKIEIISGFLGAGKTTLIKKMLKEVFPGEKIVLIENEFGEIGIDGGFLKDAGVQITEMNSGCICCSLVGDFGTALKQVIETYAPDRILIEPSGVGKLSDVTKAVMGVAAHEQVELNSSVTVVDGQKCKMYMKNFGEFFNNQVENAGTIVISRTQKMSEDKLDACVAMLREKNPKAAIITTPWDELKGEQILAAMEHQDLIMKEEMEHLMEEHDHDHHDHDHHDHDLMTITIMSIAVTTTITTITMITTITTMITDRTAPVAATIMTMIITTIMQMKYFPAGAKRLRINILRSSFERSLPDCLMTMSVALSCVQKESFRVQMEPGFTLIWFRKNLRCVTERQTTLAVCA